MVPLKARGAFTYARRNLRAGQPFEAPEKDAHVLVTIGRAERYQARVMTVEKAPEVVTVVPAVVPRRRGRPRKVKT